MNIIILHGYKVRKPHLSAVRRYSIYADGEVKISVKHYCNRQTPKKVISPEADVREMQSSNNGENGRNRESSEEKSGGGEQEEVVFPPGCSAGYLEDDGISVRIYGEDDENTNAAGGAISQCNTYKKQLDSELVRRRRGEPAERNVFADNMSGRFNVLSVPSADGEAVGLTMPMYLNNYLGKYICLDLWTNESRRIEKCGILADVGLDFVVIKSTSAREKMLIDLKTVRYISIYCR